MNTGHSTRESTTRFRYSLSVHNVPKVGNILFVNICWTFTFCIKKSMKENTSHLMGNFIESAIINTSYKKQTHNINTEWLREKGQMFKITLCVANSLIKTFSFLLSEISLYHIFTFQKHLMDWTGILHNQWS